MNQQDLILAVHNNAAHTNLGKGVPWQRTWRIRKPLRHHHIVLLGMMKTETLCYCRTNASSSRKWDLQPNAFLSCRLPSLQALPEFRIKRPHWTNFSHRLNATIAVLFGCQQWRLGHFLGLLGLLGLCIFDTIRQQLQGRFRVAPHVGFSVIVARLKEDSTLNGAGHKDRSESCGDLWEGEGRPTSATLTQAPSGANLLALQPSKRLCPSTL